MLIMSITTTKQRFLTTPNYNRFSLQNKINQSICKKNWTELELEIQMQHTNFSVSKQEDVAILLCKLRQWSVANCQSNFLT